MKKTITLFFALSIAISSISQQKIEIKINNALKPRFRVEKNGSTDFLSSLSAEKPIDVILNIEADSKVLPASKKTTIAEYEFVVISQKEEEMMASNEAKITIASSTMKKPCQLILLADGSEILSIDLPTEIATTIETEKIENPFQSYNQTIFGSSRGCARLLWIKKVSEAKAQFYGAFLDEKKEVRSVPKEYLELTCYMNSLLQKKQSTISTMKNRDLKRLIDQVASDSQILTDEEWTKLDSLYSTWLNYEIKYIQKEIKAPQNIQFNNEKFNINLKDLVTAPDASSLIGNALDIIKWRQEVIGEKRKDLVALFEFLKIGELSTSEEK